MKIIIFGATGSVGRHIVDLALDEGHEITAFARTPHALRIEHENLTLVAGDAFDPVSVSEAVKGHDCVMVTLGSPKLTGKIRSVGTKNILGAMEQHGVKRLICQTTLGIGDSYNNLNFFWKYLMFGMILRRVYDDHVVQEALVKRSSISWTIVRPSSFADGPATGSYKSGFGPQEKGLSLKITRMDIAEFMLRQIDNNKYLRHCVGISN